MITRNLIVLSIATLVFACMPSSILAKKILPRAKPATSTKTAATGTGGKVGMSVKFRGDRRAIIVNFSNLTSATNVNYTLNYTSRGTTQGAGGSINPEGTGASASRELIFGTCSHGVCRYDSGITNAKLTVLYTATNGKRYGKTFRIKV